jgi:transcriptional regulator with XRE-family HTH domain
MKSRGRWKALSPWEQLAELQAALSLNQSQLARILRVTRKTLSGLLKGDAPGTDIIDRTGKLLSILTTGNVSSTHPLNARFVRQPSELEARSLVDLLSDEELDLGLLHSAIDSARRLGEEDSRKRKQREDRLRALGFERLDRQQRKAQLARNTAIGKGDEQ